MPRREPLPPQLGTAPFAVSTAVALGVTRDRLRSVDLIAPFYGTRASREPASVEDLCAALAPRLLPDHVFTHTTAAALWGVPLPLGVSGEGVHVALPSPRRAPEGRGVIGHALSFGRHDVRTVRGFRVASPAATWCQLAESLDVADLVAAADWLVTGNPFEKVLPVASVDELSLNIRRRSHSRGIVALRSAVSLIREGALSRPESLLRVLCVRGGLPEPRVNESCNDDRGSFIALVDLSWPEHRVVVEYEGDGHRDKQQFRSDIHRIEKLFDNQWSVVRVSADDLFRRPRETLARIASRLQSNGWRGAARPRSVTRFRP